MSTQLYPSIPVYFVYPGISRLAMFSLEILYTLYNPYISCVPIGTLVIVYTLYNPYLSCVPMFTLVILYTLYTLVYPVYLC